MFRSFARLPRRTGLSAAATAAVLVHEHESRRDKLPIYPAPDPEIVLQEVPSELEHQIGRARVTLTNTYEDARTQVQGVISRWIGVENAVENRLKSLVAPEEPLTPGLLYVGVATLTGSVLARNRGIFLRATLPPALLILSFAHFLPRTAHNVSSYLGALEDTYAPGLAEKHEIGKAHAAMTWARLREATQESRASLGEGVVKLVDRFQDATGLKVREALGVHVQQQQQQPVGVIENAKAQVAEGVQVVEKKAEEAREVVQAKVEDAKEAVETKTEEVKRLL